jgi:hypothetical protein
MDGLSTEILVSLILTALTVIVLILAPLIRRKPLWMPFPEGGRVAELLAEKEKMLRAIKDVEFEFENGTLSQEDRDTLRADYKSKAVAVIKEIEAITKGRSPKETS